MQEWITWYNSGMTMNQISKRVGISRQLIAAYLRRHGVKIKPRGGRINENLALQNKALRRGK
jgi:DNA-binding transcriptional regulator LsrR (DeoR family)